MIYRTGGGGGTLPHTQGTCQIGSMRAGTSLKAVP